ncbi:cobyrinate a,c-diamide synthase [Anaerocolumna sp. MB42-C2]|uniref:cobyrinate a,c-diamide synthase n=1 Tax=Anaerocolumna sp. MB42-C2 TaxID=3070997 RepID=UPI0027DF825C|nr:cobyrinate a,c-diamide synthase [Anaerocolumna sp. MB42-C2]WMJ89529.1 cobyrinate a,c-diamide synthase [Anaerocolumna sp. MB42-C2]
MKQINRIMLAGTKSGAGKTTITLSILQGLVDRGYKVSSFKCGPDYIDPMFHSKVIGTKSGNLDSFFCDDDTLMGLLYQNSRDTDISVMEGVMGYYDGIGFSDTGSTYSIAAITKTPVILIVDAKGISGSLGALLHGFSTYKKESYIKGVIFNRLPDRLYDSARKLAEDMGIQAIGYVPVLREWELESRHLGLVTADEIIDIKERIKRLADRLSNTIDFKKILTIAGMAEPLSITEDLPYLKEKEKISIAVAQDEAFCFIYRDNLERLKEAGAKLYFFSPLRDKTLPEKVDGLLLCGGYPELYARDLSRNTSLLHEIKTAIENGIPTIAECGGFMYLHETMEDSKGLAYPMAGVIPGKCFKTKHLQRFGYIYLKGLEESLAAGNQEMIKAHEFHYWDSESCGKDFHAVKPDGSREWECVHASKTLYAGFPHLYFSSDNSIAKRFIDRCMQYRISPYHYKNPV